MFFVHLYQHPWSLLRLETDRIGAEVEQWAYADLNRPAEAQLPIERMVAEMSVYFQIDLYETRPNGGLCINAHGGPPTLLGIKPSYCFFKRRDGSVYY